MFEFLLYYILSIIFLVWGFRCCIKIADEFQEKKFFPTELISGIYVISVILFILTLILIFPIYMIYELFNSLSNCIKNNQCK